MTPSLDFVSYLRDIPVSNLYNKRVQLLYYVADEGILRAGANLNDSDFSLFQMTVISLAICAQ